MQFRENIYVMFHLSPVIQKELVIKMSRCFKETDNKLCDLNLLKQDWKAQTETIQCANKKPVTNKLVASELWEMPVNFPQEDKKISYWSFWPSVSNFLAGWRRKPCSAPVSGKPPRSSAHGSDEETWWPPDRVSDWIWRCLAVYKVTSTEIYFRKGDRGVMCSHLLLFQEGILHHHGEMGNQHQTGCQLAEQSPEQLHLDTVWGDHWSLH